MPYYSDISTPGSAKSLFPSGPYANHSSIIASNYIPYTNTLPRQYRGGYKPQLTTISELNSPLRRVDSPKLYHSSPKVSVRPIKIIDTADIDVSVNKYRKFNKYERTKPDILDLKPVEKTPSPKTLQVTEEKEAKPTTTIKRERATVRIKTVHEDTFKNEIKQIKSWRDNFKEDELFETEGKRVRKTPGEILKEKFLIRSKSKENIAKNELDLPSSSKRRRSVSKSPSFRDICKAITTDDNIDDLNPGQPLDVQRKQSRQVSTEDIINHIRRSSTQLTADDLNILDHILQKEAEDQDTPSIGVKKKKKAAKNKTGELLPSENTVADSEQEKEGRGTVKKKKVDRKDTSDNSAVPSDFNCESRSSIQKKRTTGISKSSSKDILLIEKSPISDETVHKCEDTGSVLNKSSSKDDIRQLKDLDISTDLIGNIIRLTKAPSKFSSNKDKSELKPTITNKTSSDDVLHSNKVVNESLADSGKKENNLNQEVVNKFNSSTSLSQEKVVSLDKSSSSKSLQKEKAIDESNEKTVAIAESVSKGIITKQKPGFNKSESASSLPDGEINELNKSSSSKSLPEKKSDILQKNKTLKQPEEVLKDSSPLQQKPLMKKSTGNELIHKTKMAEPVSIAPETTIRDISQVDIEQTVFKPKPVITGTIGKIEEKKAPPKVMVDTVEIVESPKKKDKKFRFNLDVEVKAEPQKIKMPIENGVVETSTPKYPLVISILKKKPLSLVGQVLEEKERALRTKKIVTEKETDSTARNFVDIAEDSQVDKKIGSKIAPLSLNKNKEESKAIPKRKIFATKVSQSSTESSAPSSPVKIVSPFTKNDDVFVKRTVIVPRNKTEKSVEDQKDNDSKFKDNDDFARPLSPLRQHGEVLDHAKTEPIKKTDNNTVVQKKAPSKVTPKVVEKKTISPASLEDRHLEANKVVNGEAKLGKRELVAKKEAEAKTNEEVNAVNMSNIKGVADGEIKEKVEVKPTKKEIIVKKEEVGKMSDMKSVTDAGLKEKVDVKPTKKKIIAKKEEEPSKARSTEVQKETNDLNGGAKNNEEVHVKTAKNKYVETNGEVEVQKGVEDCDGEAKIGLDIGVKTTKDKRTAGKEEEGSEMNGETAAVEPKENKSEIEVNIKTVALKEEPAVSADKKLMSKRSLVQKADKDDPDLQVFVPPEPEPEPVPEQKETFVPLQSNRLTQFMHPWKKPEQFDVCPVEIWAKPKVIRGRHYPRPRGHPAVQSRSQEESEDSETEEESESEEESSSSSEETATSEEEEGECEGGTAKVAGASTSSVDSGFGSGAACKKESSDSRDSPSTSPLAHNSEYSLDSECIPEEFSASSTYASFQKTGRITPPATTIPRFKKYSIDDFNFLKVLGKGSFGKVMLAELKGTEYYYAVKCLKKDVVLEDDDVECTLIERKVLALGTKHPYLCHLLCTFQTESHLFFVMEYLNGGDLMFHIQASGRFPEDDARFYGAEIVSGLKFLHTKGIVYRDLKLDNVLLDFDGHVRIADFGMCKLQIFLDRMAESFCGTPDYMAPEIIKGQHYNQCVDWWSFGVLLYEMLSGTSPFSGCDEDELFWSICNEKPVMPKYFSTYAKEILSQLLEKDASKRLGNRFSPHGDIQDHNFFKKIDWYALEKRQLEAPFKPNLQHPLDTQYFDKHFTVEKAKLTPVDATILESIDQTQFQGFSYTNPNATDK